MGPADAVHPEHSGGFERSWGGSGVRHVGPVSCKFLLSCLLSERYEGCQSHPETPFSPQTNPKHRIVRTQLTPPSSPPSACQSVSPFEQRTTPLFPRGTRVPALPWTQHTDETFAAVRLNKGKIGSSQKQKLRDGLGTVGRRTLTRQALILPPQSSVFLGLDYGKTTRARYHQGKVFYRARQSHLPPEPKDHA